MRAAATCVVFALVLAAGALALAEPTVTIYTDAETYQSGGTIEVSLSAENDDEALSVDVYVGIILPDGDIWSTQGGDWNHSIEAWIRDIYVPAWFELAPTMFWTFDLPCGLPPIDEAGDYAFAALLAYPGTFTYVSIASLAPFNYGSAGPSTDITMVSIPAGSFLMGSPSSESGRFSDEGPQRTVNISAFQMSETEVTQKQWEDVMGWKDCLFSGDDHPVERVTWFDCVSFCSKLSQAHGYAQCYTMTNIGYNANHITSADVSCNFEANGYRLPTEAEWEYACRAGTTTRFYWGDSSHESIMKQYCWYEKNAYAWSWTDPHADEEGTQSVGQKMSNSFGLCDVSGNVWEWCWDWYDDDYYGTRPDPDSDPTGPSSGSYPVRRGGSWCSWPELCRSAMRAEADPSGRSDIIGFRVSRSR